MEKPTAFNYADYVRLIAKYNELRNEHCLMCGKYRREFMGACADCKWRKEQ